jgi:hypothetical protein
MDTATGSQTMAEDNLIAALAASVSFIAWTGSADEEEAAGHVYVDDLDQPEQDKEEYDDGEYLERLPFVVLEMDSLAGTVVGMGSSFDFAHGGRMTAHFIGPVDEGTANSPSLCGRKFKNAILGILSDLESVAGTAGYLAFTSYQIAKVWRGRNDQITTKGDLLYADVEFAW